MTTPLVAADVQHIAVHHSAVAGGQGGHHGGVVVAAAAYFVQRLFITQAVAGHESSAAFAAKTCGAEAGNAGGCKVGAAHPQAAINAVLGPLLCQPMCQPHMVRVHVRDHHTQHGQALQFAVKNALPSLARGVVGDAAIHNRPTLAALDLIAQQPQVDVIQRKRQPHAQPAHAGSQFDGAARLGQRIAQGVVQLLFQFIHHCPTSGLCWAASIRYT